MKRRGAKGEEEEMRKKRYEEREREDRLLANYRHFINYIHSPPLLREAGVTMYQAGSTWSQCKMIIFAEQFQSREIRPPERLCGCAPARPHAPSTRLMTPPGGGGSLRFSLSLPLSFVVFNYGWLSALILSGS